ncbi:hypothetical protein GCM10010468_44190 [Actinocorallia longicatena]|uniref:SMODS and SLOG-associating 2TM effector domain-containing protein n=1 Tax=Actinocorallia longicatena TaxID=111803 RepID=A0ABP6QFY7_9ACTN
MAVCTELHRIEEQCAASAREQEEIVRLWRIVNMLLCSAAVLASGVAGSLVLASAPVPMAAGGLGMGATLLMALVCVVAPARRAGRAALSAKSYGALRTQARQAWQVDLNGQAFGEARQTLHQLTDRWDRVNDLALPTPRWARRRAEEEIMSTSVEEVMVGRMNDVLSIFPVQA